jgi:hypothetical protein
MTPALFLIQKMSEERKAKYKQQYLESMQQYDKDMKAHPEWIAQTSAAKSKKVRVQTKPMPIFFSFLCGNLGTMNYP